MNKPDIKKNTSQKDRKRIKEEFALDIVAKRRQKPKINSNQAIRVYA